MGDNETSETELQRKFPTRPNFVNETYLRSTLSRRDLVDVGRTLSFNGPNLHVEADEWSMRAPVESLINQFPNPAINELKLSDESLTVTIVIDRNSTFLLYWSEEAEAANAVAQIKHIGRLQPRPPFLRLLLRPKAVLVLIASVAVSASITHAISDQLRGRNAAAWAAGLIFVPLILGNLVGWLAARVQSRPRPAVILHPDRVSGRSLVRMYSDHIQIGVALAVLVMSAVVVLLD